MTPSWLHGMTFRWFEGLPFAFSIALKLISSVFTEYFRNTFARDVPMNYRLSEDQKQTLASMALDANKRMTYVVAIFVSILSATIISYKNQASGYALLTAFGYGIAGIVGSFKMNAQQLGWMESPYQIGKWQIRRSSLLTFILIVAVDLVLLGVSIISSVPSLKF